jgi:hypothetical protein
MPALPQDILVLVLRHVNQAERLSSCALVSTAWAQAAVMASDDLIISTSGYYFFMPWLQHHGSHVTKFSCAYRRTRNDKELLSMLPCSNLQELALDEWWVSLGPMEGSPGILQAVTRLTKLQLNIEDHEDLMGGLESLTVLHALPALQHFDLSVEDTWSFYNEPNAADELPSGVISGLTTLTWLGLTGVLAVESFQPFICLTKLQHLDLDLERGVKDTTDALQSELQPFKQLHALTHLSMQLQWGQLVSTSSSPAFSGCSGLQDLCLSQTYVDASAFQGMTGLRVLELWVGSVVMDASPGGVTALLRHIASMQHLQRLVVGTGKHNTLVPLEGGGAELCSAVTASPHLTYLVLRGVQLPPAAWVHIFAPGRRLVQLHALDLCFGGTDGFESSALEQLVTCCPAIQTLSSENMSLFKRDVSLAPLLQLQQLAQLECPSVVDGAASVDVLARLSCLTSLHLNASPGLTDVGLLQLTVLKGLQELRVGTAGWNRPCEECMAVMQGGRDLFYEVSTLRM